MDFLWILAVAVGLGVVSYLIVAFMFAMCLWAACGACVADRTKE